MRGKRIILIEFNELCPDLLQSWIAAGLLPNFRAFFEHSQAFITESDEIGPPYLEPWIQWYSIHTGLSYQQHKVFHLTDGPTAGHDDIWRVLLRSGKAVGNFSSMNARGFAREGSFFVPDPWCTTERAFPDELNIFHKVVAHNVHEYTNQDGHPLSTGAYWSFLLFLASRGLRLSTAHAIGRQVFVERVVRRDTAWQRASVLDKLQFDVFRYYQRALRPDFATFFSNSTAHYQHAYWRHMAPEVFRNRPQASEIAKYKNAILFGYQEMDKLLKDFATLEADGVMLMLATALSQQPFLKREGSGGQHFYRPRDIELLMKDLNVRYESITPVMAHQYVVRFKNDADTQLAREQLESLEYESVPIFGFAASAPDSLYFGSEVFTAVPESGRISVRGEPERSFRYYDVFYRIPETKSGWHHPDGVLWVKTGKQKIHPEKVSILDIFPTLLDWYGIGAEREPVRVGRSLVPLWT